MISLDLGAVSSPILYIVLGGLFGFLIWWYPHRKQLKKS